MATVTQAARDQARVAWRVGERSPSWHHEQARPRESSAADLGAGDQGIGADDAEAVAALTLAHLPRIGDRGFRMAVDTFGSAAEALSKPAALRALLPRASLGRHARVDATATALEHVERARSSGLFIWTYGGRGYPDRLRALHDPPAALWGRGDPAWLEASAGCAIVGSRRATPYGLRTAHALGQSLSRAGIVVVSGMALGIDGAAHRGALDAGGGTIAVLGSGVDTPTPTSQKALYERILHAGLVVSEFAPGTPAAPHNFPRRNRIIAALSTSLVVVEAARRSGALITVDHALDLGLSIFAVPGPIDTARSQGPNALLADGANVVLSPRGLVEALGGGRMPEMSGAQPVSGDARHADTLHPTAVPVVIQGAVARAVWRLLGDGPMDVDTLAERLREPPSAVLGALGVLELEGLVQSEPGARYVRVEF